ncbi:MAG: iron transporter [Phycisphaerae bacterium]|nr:MAG: iron transporter [Phycisphaerae bacterium]
MINQSETSIRRVVYFAMTTLAAVVFVAGCKPPSSKSESNESVVLYSSVDERFLRDVIAQYEKETGARVELVTDSEAGKTTGLVNRIRAEKEHPRANVFWSSEQSQTVLLAREGLLTAYDSPSAADIHRVYHDEGDLWTGFAMRARVIAYMPEQTEQQDVPNSWKDLAKPEVASKLAIANPLFGTTRGHVAALAASWGNDRLRTYLQELVAHGVLVTDGNSTAVRRLIAGEVRFAMTDSDDVLVAQRRGHKIAMVFPELEGAGILTIPNTVALVAGSEKNKAAHRLIDYILSAKVERMLAKSDSGNYPVRPALCEELNMPLFPANLVSPDEIADAMPVAIRICRETLLK